MLIYGNRKSSSPSACSMRSSSLRYTSSLSPRLCSHRRSYNPRHRVYNQAAQLRQSLQCSSRTRGLREPWNTPGKIRNTSSWRKTIANLHTQSEQDGQHNPLGPSRSLLPSHVRKTNHQRRSAEESQHVARRGRCCSSESSKSREEALSKCEQQIQEKHRQQRAEVG